MTSDTTTYAIALPETTASKGTINASETKIRASTPESTKTLDVTIKAKREKMNSNWNNRKELQAPNS